MNRTPRRPLLTSSSLALFAYLMMGCTASLDGSDTGAQGTSGGPSGTEPGTSAPPTPSDWTPGGTEGDPNALATLPLRMITSAQYEITLEHIFEGYGVDLPLVDVTSVLPGEAPDKSGFAIVGAITDVAVLRYMDAARDVTAAAMPSASQWVGCDLPTVADEVACVSSFVNTFGKLLYRQPVSAELLATHVEFYQHERSELARSQLEALSQLLQSMLNSPYFLYRWELGPTAPTSTEGAIRLSAYQIASRLAFFLWGSGPDQSLLDAAETGTLDTTEGVAAQASLMLASPRAQDSLDSFHSQWLNLDRLEGLFKDPARFPEWDTDLSRAMQDEIRAFTGHVILQADGRLETLLSAPYSFLNEDLALVYGIPGVVGPELRQVDLPPSERAGLLTMPGLLAAASEPSVENPFKRGKLLLNHVMCEHLEPPPNIPPVPPPDASNPRPVRETLEELTGDAPCSSCHQTLNPLGFAFANYNALGGYQTEDELGFPIDSNVVMADGASYTGAIELSASLAESTGVRGCLTKQWFRYATAREENSADDYSLELAYAKFEESDFNIKELLTAVVTTRSFLYRSADSGEVIQ